MLPMTKQDRPFSRDAGVTLLEVLVVLLILAGVTAAIAVPMARRGPSAADQLAEVSGQLSKARWQARQSQTSVSVQLATDATFQSDLTLPAFAQLADLNEAQREIVFFPDGSVLAPDLRLGDQIVSLDVLTGALRVD